MFPPKSRDQELPQHSPGSEVPRGWGGGMHCQEKNTEGGGRGNRSGNNDNETLSQIIVQGTAEVKLAYFFPIFQL